MEARMAIMTLDEVRLEDLKKAALVEDFEERQEWLSGPVSGTLTDVALGYAIQEGERTPLVSREEVFKALEAA
jgi:hypothetical protein